MARPLALACAAAAVALVLAGCGPYKPSFPTKLDNSNSSSLTVYIEPDLPAKVEFQPFYVSTANHCAYTPRLGLIPLTDSVPSQKSLTVAAEKLASGVYAARAPRPLNDHCRWAVRFIQEIVQIQGLDVSFIHKNGLPTIAGPNSLESQFACHKWVIKDKKRSPTPPHGFVEFDRESLVCKEIAVGTKMPDDTFATITVKVEP